MTGLFGSNTPLSISSHFQSTTHLYFCSPPQLKWHFLLFRAIRLASLLPFTDGLRLRLHYMSIYLPCFCILLSLLVFLYCNFWCVTNRMLLCLQTGAACHVFTKLISHPLPSQHVGWLQRYFLHASIRAKCLCSVYQAGKFICMLRAMCELIKLGMYLISMLHTT